MALHHADILCVVPAKVGTQRVSFPFDAPYFGKCVPGFWPAPERRGAQEAHPDLLLANRLPHNCNSSACPGTDA